MAEATPAGTAAAPDPHASRPRRSAPAQGSDCNRLPAAPVLQAIQRRARLRHQSLRQLLGPDLFSAYGNAQAAVPLAPSHSTGSYYLGLHILSCSTTLPSCLTAASLFLRSVHRRCRMEGFQRTRLWSSALADTDGDAHADPRRRLEAALLAFRGRAAVLAAMIPEDLRDFTTHDITHSDGLWEMADVIAGSEVDLTPTEAFVLGGAFLVHDLGLALASYPSGFESLRKEDRWLDTVTALLNDYGAGTPTREEISSPPEEIRLLAKEAVLRELHAERAKHLVDTSWRDQERDETYHLLEDADLRRDYGPLIGELAASHGWPVSKLPTSFPTQYGAPVWCPPEWTIQPIKLAALLRVADAAHVTAARAPGFARALRKPSDPSRQHWVFQEHLHRPIADGDRLKYTSTRAFPLSEAASWWLSPR